MAGRGSQQRNANDGQQTPRRRQGAPLARAAEGAQFHPHLGGRRPAFGTVRESVSVVLSRPVCALC